MTRALTALALALGGCSAPTAWAVGLEIDGFGKCVASGASSEVSGATLSTGAIICARSSARARDLGQTGDSDQHHAATIRQAERDGGIGDAQPLGE